MCSSDLLSDHVAVLDHGRIVAEGTPGELKHRIPGAHIRLHFADPDTLNTAAHLLDVASRDDENLCLRVPSDSSAASLRRLLNLLENAGLDVEHVSIHTPDLDDVFFAVTGHHSAEELSLS